MIAHHRGEGGIGGERVHAEDVIGRRGAATADGAEVVPARASDDEAEAITNSEAAQT